MGRRSPPRGTGRARTSPSWSSRTASWRRCGRQGCRSGGQSWPWAGSLSGQDSDLGDFDAAGLGSAGLAAGSAFTGSDSGLQPRARIRTFASGVATRIRGPSGDTNTSDMRTSSRAGRGGAAAPAPARQTGAAESRGERGSPLNAAPAVTGIETHVVEQRSPAGAPEVVPLGSAQGRVLVGGQRDRPAERVVATLKRLVVLVADTGARQEPSDVDLAGVGQVHADRQDAVMPRRGA